MSQALEPILLEFVKQHVGSVQKATFVGWDHAESRVWKVESGNGVVFLKAHRQPRKFQQERFAYENWVPHLPCVTPQLVAVRTEVPTALLLTAVAGQVAESTALSEKQRLKLHHDAGCFLKSMHLLPWSDNDISIEDAYRQRLESWVVRAAGHLPSDEISWVQLQVADALPSLKNESRVPCHRDFTPRNWLVDEVGQIRVIDFEHARPDLWFMDIERLWSRQWLKYPECADAFWAGYERTLSDEETQTLARCSTLSAMSTIVWAREHDDSAFEAEGRRSFVRLRKLL